MEIRPLRILSTAIKTPDTVLQKYVKLHRIPPESTPQLVFTFPNSDITLETQFVEKFTDEKEDE